MNVSADPCTDFDDYVCGKFYATKTIKQGESEISFGSSIEEKNIEVLQGKISTEKPVELVSTNEVSKYKKGNIERYLQSCIRKKEY